MAIIIQWRRGTAAEWTSVNPLLADGEVGLETDTLKIKVGNGVQNWVALPYMIFGGGPQGPQGWQGPSSGGDGASEALMLMGG